MDAGSGTGVLRKSSQPHCSVVCPGPKLLPLPCELTDCLCFASAHIFSASDNIPKADTIRTLIKDLWDTRMAKLRVSADSFVRQQEAHAKVGMAFLSPPGASGHCQPV